MLIDANKINRRDVAEVALTLTTLPDYDEDRSWLSADLHNATREAFPYTLEYGDHVAYAAASEAARLARTAARMWREYGYQAHRAERLKRDYRNAAHDARARYEAMRDLGWARESRDLARAQAIDAVRLLMGVDMPAYAEGIMGLE